MNKKSLLSSAFIDGFELSTYYYISWPHYNRGRGNPRTFNAQHHVSCSLVAALSSIRCPFAITLLRCGNPYQSPLMPKPCLSRFPYSCPTLLGLVSRFRLRVGVPCIILSCQSVKEYLLFWEVGGVFPVLVVQAADPAFRLQRYILIEYVIPKSLKI